MARILVVEDETDLRTLLRTVIELAGHEVVEVSSGEDALRHAEEVDVVLLDLKLPGIDGWELLERLPRPLPATVVVMSAHGDDAAREEAFRRGCAAYLTKPFRLAELHAVLPPATGRP